MLSIVKLARLTLEDTAIEQKVPDNPAQERDSATGRYLKKLEPTVPLSPSISSISSLPVTPRSQSPEPPIEPTEPPIRATDMAPTTEEKLFRGDYSAGEKPHIWFRRLEGKFNEETKLATKLYRFAKNLEPGRPAELWYKGLSGDKKLDWEDFYKTFTGRWPLPTIVEPSREELLEKLSQMKLTNDDIGVMTERDGDRVYTHVVWAEEIRALVDVLDDAKGHLIPQVRRDLPLSVRLTLPSNLNSWNTFLAAVTSLSMDRLADQRENTEVIRDNILQTMGTTGQRQYNTNSMTTKLATPSSSFYPPARPISSYAPRAPVTQTNPSHPTVQTPSAVRQTPIQPWTPRVPATPTHQRFNQPMSTPSGAFLSNNSTLHPSSIFANVKQQVPQTPSSNHSQLTNQDLARKAIAASSTFLNNPEGHAAYLTALQAWEAVYPPTREVDFTTAPYPLSPGTAPLGSRECYTCGIYGHITKDHDPAIPQINVREQRWRAFVGRNLFARGRLDFTPVSQINVHEEETIFYDPAIYNATQLTFDEEQSNQGNGEEAHE